MVEIGSLSIHDVTSRPSSSKNFAQIQSPTGFNFSISTFHESSSSSLRTNGLHFEDVKNGSDESFTFSLFLLLTGKEMRHFNDPLPSYPLSKPSQSLLFTVSSSEVEVSIFKTRARWKSFPWHEEARCFSYGEENGYVVILGQEGRLFLEKEASKKWREEKSIFWKEKHSPCKNISPQPSSSSHFHFLQSVREWKTRERSILKLNHVTRQTSHTHFCSFL